MLAAAVAALVLLTGGSAPRSALRVGEETVGGWFPGLLVSLIATTVGAIRGARRRNHGEIFSAGILWALVAFAAVGFAAMVPYVGLESIEWVAPAVLGIAGFIPATIEAVGLEPNARAPILVVGASSFSVLGHALGHPVIFYLNPILIALVVAALVVVVCILGGFMHARSSA